MKKIILLLMLVLVTSTFAAEGKHAVAFGVGGLGLAGGSEKIKSANFTSYSQSNSQKAFAVNYAYYFSSGFILGANVDYFSAENKFNTGSYESVKKISRKELIIHLGYNFNDDFYNSWWVLGSLGLGSYKDETKDSSLSLISYVWNSYLYQRDHDYKTWGFSAGKRFDLKSIGIDQMSYAPSVALFSRIYDSDLKSTNAYTIEPIRFELLF